MNTATDQEKARQERLAKKEVKQQNIKAIFGSGMGRFALIAVGIIVLIFAAFAYRGLTKNAALEAEKSQVDTPAPALDAKPVDAVTEAEKQRRDLQSQREAEAAMAAGDTYQASFDVNIIEAPPAVDVNALAGDNPLAPPAPETTPPAAEDEQLVRQREQAAAAAAQRTEQEFKTQSDAREKYIESIKTRAMAQAESLVGGGAMNNFGSYTLIAYPKPAPVEPVDAGTSTSTDDAKAANKPIIFKAGSTQFATLDGEINTDDGSDVFATIRGGPWDGSRLLGKVEKTQNNIRAIFTTLAPQDDRPTMPINAIALRSEDAKQGIATKIDHHTLSRYSSLGFASLLSGYGKSFEQTPGTTIVNPGGTTVQTVEEPSTRQILGRAGGEMGSAFAEEIKKGFNRPATYSTPADTGFAIFFLSDVSAP